MTDKPKLLRIPDQLNSVEEVISTLQQMDLECVVVLAVGKDEFMTVMHNKVSSGHINWYLDRAKFMIHNAES